MNDQALQPCDPGDSYRNYTATQVNEMQYANDPRIDRSRYYCERDMIELRNLLAIAKGQIAAAQKLIEAIEEMMK